jgi:hypothetical protein
MKHKHHIIPKHMGGTDDATNIVELTIDEHAEAHRILYELHGKIGDKVAWMGLAKMAPMKELIVELQRETKLGKNNPMFGKPSPNKGIKRPGIGGRKKGTKWSEKERETQMLKRSIPGYHDFLKSPERGKKISQAQKGRPGTATGKTWFNNGVKETYSFNCPEGFIKGRLPKKQISKRGMRWYNNGTINRQFKDEDILEGFVRGKLSKK